MSNTNSHRGTVGGHIPSTEVAQPEVVSYDEDKQLYYITGRRRESIAVQAPYTTNPVSLREFRYLENISWSCDDQESTDSCVAFAVAGILEALHYRGTGYWTTHPSQWVYGNRSGFMNQVEGMYTVETLARVVRDGVPTTNDLSELRRQYNYSGSISDYLYQLSYNLHNYRTNDGSGYTAKSVVSGCYSAVLPYAQRYRILSYHNISTWDTTSIKNALVGISPLYFAIDVANVDYAMYANTTGILDRNHRAGESYVDRWGYADKLRDGSHVMMIIGWKIINNSDHYVIRNSWGSYGGDNGFIYIPVSLFSSVGREVYCLRPNTSQYMLEFTKRNFYLSIFKFLGNTQSRYVAGAKINNFMFTDIFNNLSYYINSRRSSVGLPALTVTISKVGEPITASQFNALKNGFNEYTRAVRNVTAINVADKYPGDKILASDIWSFFDAVETN